MLQQQTYLEWVVVSFELVQTGEFAKVLSGGQWGGMLHQQTDLEWVVGAR